jgi:glycosyltransferase involved in cell wall biosynthesis
MRVLFLGLHDRGRSPSQRYRFEAFEPYLRSRGVDVVYAGVLDARDAQAFYGATPPRTKARIAAKALARRIASLRHRADVVFVQREAFFLFGAWSEWLAHLRAPLVFDFDDAIWMSFVSEANRRFAFLKNVEKIPRIARMAHTVLAGNEFLAQWARRHSANVHVVPTVVDTDWFSPAPARAPGPVTVGWSGSGSTLPQLEPVLPALAEVKARFGDRVSFRIMGLPTFAHAPAGIRGEPWTPDAELAMLREASVGMMPLPDDEWTLGKCGLKALVSMATGAATVASPVGVSREFVRHGENGLLASTHAEWVDALSRLVEDDALRARLGAEGRRTVVERYSVEAWREPFHEVLRRAAEDGPRRR